VQLRLVELGYLVVADVDGRFGPTTANAVLAFQKWERLSRTGLLDKPTEARLARALRPASVTHVSAAKRAEILLDRQVALLISGSRVVRTISVSTGKPSTPTPPGRYRVYAKIQRWWSTPFPSGCRGPCRSSGGIAFHEYPVVPAYPASHGCVRQAFSVAHSTYDFAEIGMPVTVLANS
jgi:lipoprotein-anchoring transpeptidase ErfK/SrfK